MQISWYGAVFGFAAQTDSRTSKTSHVFAAGDVVLAALQWLSVVAVVIHLQSMTALAYGHALLNQRNTKDSTKT